MRLHSGARRKGIQERGTCTQTHLVTRKAGARSTAYERALSLVLALPHAFVDAWYTLSNEVWVRIGVHGGLVFDAHLLLTGSLHGNPQRECRHLALQTRLQGSHGFGS
jgi:hypothetical protein